METLPRADAQPAKNGAVAETCTRTSSLAGRHSAFKSQPRKLRSPGASLRSGALPFQQRTNTSCYLAIPTHGFTVALSVFWGTPPAKPLNCKSVSNRLGARLRSGWAYPTGGTPRHSCAATRLALSDDHQDIALVSLTVPFTFRFDCSPSHIPTDNKNPAYSR